MNAGFAFVPCYSALFLKNSEDTGADLGFSVQAIGDLN